MKKFIFLFVAFVLLGAVVTANAEEPFSIRNGIKFGMSLEEVEKIEKK